MTEDEDDRGERFANGLDEQSLRELRDSREQTEKLRLLVRAQEDLEAAQLAVQERPVDAEAIANLLRTQQALMLARETLRRSTQKR